MALLNQFHNNNGGPKAWRDLFQKVDMESTALIRKKKLSTKFAVARVNLDKNRYTNVLPYDQNRVQLSGENDYINASFVSVQKAKRKYILCQGPVEESLTDFWQMIYDHKVPAIVMLNKLFEGGSLKCEKYYPCTQNPVMIFDNYIVKIEDEKKTPNFTTRKLFLTNTETNVGRTVIQVQYTEWPDFGVPASTAHFLEMLNYIKDLAVLSTDLENPPVVVHCSAGIGRSGTFVLVDSVLRMIELHVPETEIDPNGLLVELRSQRMGLIQTPEQLQFAWTAIVDDLKSITTGDGSSGGTSNGVLSEPSPINVEIRKRKSETHEEIDERTAKRRELISNMVRKNRQHEESCKRNSNIFSTKSLLLGGVAVVASIFVYYYFRR